jgi:hypothetical protein
MINYKEVRVGNLVNYDGKTFELHTINEELPCLNTIEFGIGVVEWKHLGPIELTEEILLKCGFGRSDEHEMSINEPIEMSIDYHFKRCYLFGGIDYIKDFKYLHQLQNLYWCLTNQELIYTP